MRALVLEAPESIAYRRDLPDPEIVEDTDAVVAVHRAGLCGSDLHPYQGREAVRFGVVAGHEVVGEVVAIGAGVATVRPGARVIVPFTTSCGSCDPCRSGLSARCHRGQLFGYGPPDNPELPALHGGQAELVRVPFADGTLVAVPSDLDDPTALLLADNLPTGWYAVERSEAARDRPLAVVGLGAVGLCTLAAARSIGANPLLAVDPVADRRERAAELGAIPAHPDEAASIAEELGLASVIEAAGTREAQRLATSLLRPGGTLSIIAVQTEQRFGFSPVEAYDRNLTVRAGRAPVRSLLSRLLPRVLAGDIAVPSELVVTHPTVPLAEGPAAYRRFASREPGLVKLAFIP